MPCTEKCTSKINHLNSITFFIFAFHAFIRKGALNWEASILSIIKQMNTMSNSNVKKRNTNTNIKFNLKNAQ